VTIVRTCSFSDGGDPSGAALLWTSGITLDRKAKRSLEIEAGIAALGLGDILGRAGCDDPTTTGAALGAEVDQIIRRLDDVEIMLDHHYRISLLHQRMQEAS